MDELRSGRAVTRATVIANLPNAMFQLRLGDGTELTAHVAGEVRMSFTRLLPGDVVTVEVSAFDRTKARISEKPETR